MIVVDCAAVVDALSGAPGGLQLRSWMVGEQLHAPMLLDVEVVSAVRAMVLGRRLSAGRARELLDDYDDLPVERWAASGPLRLRAFQLRDRMSAYDAAYVVLAESLGCPLLTRDARLAGVGGHDARIEVCAG